MLSIITVNYNDADSLSKTLDSISSQKADSRLYEVVVIDGSSIDNSLDIIENNKNIINNHISEPDSGIYNAMNKGLKLAKGSYVIFMNAGDTFVDDNTLTKILDDIGKQPDFDIYYSNAIYERDGLEHINFSDHKNIMLKMPFNHQSAIISRELHKAILYNENYRISSDYDFFLRANKVGAKFCKIDTMIARHSLDGISVTSPFHSCLESVHSHLMNYKSIDFSQTEYYGEFFIKEIFKTSPLITKLVLFAYTVFVKRNRKEMLKAIIRKILR